jgi:nonribosomal peptide synthetase protein BlmIV
LTDIQQAYWLGRRHGGTLGGVATHSYFELDVAGLDVARLERALDGLVRRHDALRTVVRADGQQQALAEVPPMTVPTLDLRGRPADQAAELERLRDRLSHEVRDVSRWPLFELHAVHLDGGRTRL